MASSKQIRRAFVLLLVLAVVIVWLLLPGLPLNLASANKKPAQQSSTGLSPERQATLEKLYAQFNAGDPFSEEEGIILRKFAAGALTDLEADVVISRALYDFYIAGKELTAAQEELFDRYSLFVARRPNGVADLKRQLLNKRIAAAAAAPPRTTPLLAPPNDLCSGAEVISGAGPFPFLTSTTPDITGATTTGDPPSPSCTVDPLSRSIWYTFTPTTTATYAISSCADAPTGTTVDDTVMAIYTSTGGCAGTFTEIPTSGSSVGCDDDSCVTEDLEAVITTQLNSGTQYFIVVWLDGTAPPTVGNTAVQLRVSQMLPPSNDNCSSTASLMLNTPVMGTTAFAINDYQLSAPVCFTGVGQTSSTAAGRDVVYSFTAPSADNYSFKVTGYNTANNLVLYVATSCPTGAPPINVSTCLAASNRTLSSSSEEVMCVALSSGQMVFIFVDENAVTGGSTFTIEATRCTRETEPNDTPATAGPMPFGVEASISPAGDVDFYNLGTPASGSRVFALVDGVASNNLDLDMRVTTSTDTLEYDDLNNDVLFGGASPNVAGTQLTGVQSSIRINQKSGLSVEPYRLYAVVQPAGANANCSCAATNETEPNDTTGQANSASTNFFYGSLAGPAPSTDVDLFSFAATTGDLIFLSLDCDPRRDATPINGALALLDSGGATLISVNDGGATSSTTSGAGSLTSLTPNSPGEALVWRATTAGTYFARVSIGTASAGTTGVGDYLLSISLNGQVGPTAAKLDTFSAMSFDNGVLLQWRTGHEVDNLGFNVYREEGGKRTRINPEILAGSALIAGPGTSLNAGQSYSWADEPQTGNRRVSYWLEDVDLNGQSTWHGPIEAKPSPLGKRLSKHNQALLLSTLAKKQPSAELATKPVGQIAEISRVSSPEFNRQSIGQVNLAGQRAVKISVKQEGWYRVGQPDLITAGLDPNVNPQNLQLYVDGRELPIIVRGEQDRKLDPADAVEFYGIGLDTPSTNRRIYWLVAGTQLGQRIETAQSQGAAGAPGSFPYTVERKDRMIYFSSLRNGEKENFFGSVVGGEPVDQALFVQHLSQALAGQAQLEVALQGVTLVSHKVNVFLNGTRVGALSFDGQAEGVARLQVSHSPLKEGNNVITLIAQGGPGDVSLVDYIRLSYRHSYIADNNALRFPATGGQQVTIDGFTKSAVRAMDVTDPDAVQEVSVVVRPEKGTYSATISVPGTSQRVVFMFTGQAIRTGALVANQPSNWRDSSQGADFVIITQFDLLDSMTPLKELRQSQGLSVAVIDIEDLYDEFSYGNKTPWAVRDFLAWTTTDWPTAPRFVLLAADASFDPKNYQGNGDFDLVATKLIDTEFMETASDDWFADFDNDGLAEIAIGRLPARTAQEANRMISKIINYDSSARPDSVLLVSDKNDGYDFESASAQLRLFIPASVAVEEIQQGLMDPTTTKSRLLDAINRGQKVISYTGHGNVDSWRNELFTSADASGLKNGNRLALFALMTCLNGYFQHPETDSLAESLMKVDRGGAIAVWASSGLTMPNRQTSMNQQLFQLLFNGSAASPGSITLGEATRRAKAFVNDVDVRRTWILFGDPTTRVR